MLYFYLNVLKKIEFIFTKSYQISYRIKKKVKIKSQLMLKLNLKKFKFFLYFFIPFIKVQFLQPNKPSSNVGFDQPNAFQLVIRGDPVEAVVEEHQSSGCDIAGFQAPRFNEVAEMLAGDELLIELLAVTLPASHEL